VCPRDLELAMGFDEQITRIASALARTDYPWMRYIRAMLVEAQQLNFGKNLPRGGAAGQA